MNNFRKQLWLNKDASLLWTNLWTHDEKKELDRVLNNHGILDNYDSYEMLTFLCWKYYAEHILDFREFLKYQKKSWMSLDIDETLSATSTTWFRKLLQLFWNPEWLTPEEMVRKYYHTQNVPYWKNNVEVLDWMHEHREDNELQKELDLIDGTLQHYQQIHKSIIPIHSYITARPDCVEWGTLDWLQEKNFPNHNQIILRPQWLDHTLSNLWKACVLDILYPYIVWIVDDNPNLVKMLPKRYEWHIFLYDKTSCEHNHINVYVCETIDDVRKSIEQTFQKKS